MTREHLVEQIRQKKSCLVIGLDTDINRLPDVVRKRPDAVIEFNRRIINATSDFCVGYKINTAFYEVMGREGWEIMQETVAHIPSTHFKIADAKRGDIGNTSGYYAKAFFDTLAFDAITVAPYMGEDSLRPFLEHDGKWTIVLGLTSNKGADDFELQKMEDGMPLYEKVIAKAATWGSIIPGHFLLVPGIGAQGGDMEAVLQNGTNADVGLLINSSRAILYASKGENFDHMAGLACSEMVKTMLPFIQSV
jgi:orotidine-5'-phosphate decarboxylase